VVGALGEEHPKASVVEGIVEALKQRVDSAGQGLAGGKVGNDTEDVDVAVEHIGLAAAVAEIEEFECVVRGGDA